MKWNMKEGMKNEKCYVTTQQTLVEILIMEVCNLHEMSSMDVDLDTWIFIVIILWMLDQLDHESYIIMLAPKNAWCKKTLT